MNLKQVDRALLYACKSEADWDAAVSEIRAACGGQLPDDWHDLMITGGLEASLRESWPKKPEPVELTVDPKRIDYDGSTGVYVRARHEGKWGSYDMAVLDRASLLEFLRSRGGDNPWAENIVGAILGHEGPIRTP